MRAFSALVRIPKRSYSSSSEDFAWNHRCKEQKSRTERNRNKTIRRKVSLLFYDVYESIRRPSLEKQERARGTEAVVRFQRSVAFSALRIESLPPPGARSLPSFPSEMLPLSPSPIPVGRGETIHPSGDPSIQVEVHLYVHRGASARVLLPLPPSFTKCICRKGCGCPSPFLSNGGMPPLPDFEGGGR